jgi:hypothetical protein
VFTACIPGAIPLDDGGVTVRAAGRGAARLAVERRAGDRGRTRRLRGAGFFVFFLVGMAFRDQA